MAAIIVVEEQHQIQRSHPLLSLEHSDLPVHLRPHTLQNQMLLGERRINHQQRLAIIVHLLQHQDSLPRQWKSLQH